MKIVHVITGLEKAAGTTTFVENVVREQRAIGHAVDICTNEVEKAGGGGQWWVSKSYDVVHMHGLWSALLHRAARYVRRHGIPIVWSTHGMTAPWSLHHKWWKKFLTWYLYQLPDLRSAALIHCTTDLEAEWNRALGFKNVFVAPLGTSLPSQTSQPFQSSQPSQRTLLYVGRIYPVKALDNAIRAVALMEHPIILRLVGPDQAGHMAELMSLCESLGLPYVKPGEEPTAGHLQPLPKQVQFIGPKYDDDLDKEYWTCDGLILVSHTENFGATVVDAMAHGKSVITSTKTPWTIVADKGCGYWVSNEPDSLARTFDTFALASAQDLNVCGQNGLALVKAEYAWPAIAENLISNYERACYDQEVVR